MKIFLKKTPKKAGVHAAYPHFPDKLSIRRIEMAKKDGAYMLLTNCPSCILSFEKGLELMRESDEPMELGIFDFFKVFSRAFNEGGNGAVGT